MVRRTYYLPVEVVERLDRVVADLQAAAYVERAPTKAAVVAAILTVGMSDREAVVDLLRPGSAHPVEVSASRRHGWRRPVGLPGSLEELRGPRSGVVRLPLAVNASGAASAEGFDVSSPPMRAAMYQIVLREGSADDVRRYVDESSLRESWSHLWLPGYVRCAWIERFPELAA